MRSETREMAPRQATDGRFCTDAGIAHGISPIRFSIEAVGVITRVIGFLPVSVVFQRPAEGLLQHIKTK